MVTSRQFLFWIYVYTLNSIFFFKQRMDIVLGYADEYVLTPYVYPSNWTEDEPLRQILSLLLVTNIGGYILYFMTATINYFLIFDSRLMKHPLFIKVRLKLLHSIYFVLLLYTFWEVIFILTVQGHLHILYVNFTIHV